MVLFLKISKFFCHWSNKYHNHNTLFPRDNNLVSFHKLFLNNFALIINIFRLKKELSSSEEEYIARKKKSKRIILTLKNLLFFL